LRTEQSGQLLVLEASQSEIEFRLVQFPQFQRKQVFIPVGPGHGAVHHEPERLHLYFTVAAGKHWITGIPAVSPQGP
jgi:hypothetical protein